MWNIRTSSSLIDFRSAFSSIGGTVRTAEAARGLGLAGSTAVSLVGTEATLGETEAGTRLNRPRFSFAVDSAWAAAGTAAAVESPGAAGGAVAGTVACPASAPAPAVTPPFCWANRRANGFPESRRFDADDGWCCCWPMLFVIDWRSFVCAERFESCFWLRWARIAGVCIVCK